MTHLVQIIKLLKSHSAISYKDDIGKTFKVLIEGDSKRSDKDWCGRNTQNKMVVFPKGNHRLNKCDYVNVKITSATSGTLIGTIID